MNIILCGMMGSGKTTVAEALSENYSLDRVDTDGIIVSRYGAIDKIFASFGEAYFRDIETEVIKEIATSLKNAVISLGGGAVLRAENVENLKRTGKIFYLRATADTIINRLKGDNTRPLLQGNLEERVHSVLSVRSGIYEGVADIIVDTDGLTPEALAKIIKEKSV